MLSPAGSLCCSRPAAVPDEWSIEQPLQDDRRGRPQDPEAPAGALGRLAGDRHRCRCHFSCTNRARLQTTLLQMRRLSQRVIASVGHVRTSSGGRFAETLTAGWAVYRAGRRRCRRTSGSWGRRYRSRRCLVANRLSRGRRVCRPGTLSSVPPGCVIAGVAMLSAVATLFSLPKGRDSALRAEEHRG